MKAAHFKTLLKFFSAVFLSILVSPLFASAGTAQNLSGWAYSSNIGWISMNCTNNNSCGSVDYGVNQNADGTLTGYAWSSNIGWIKFGGLSGFSNGNGTQQTNAQLNGNNLKGWVRAVSYGYPSNGSWDGWIALSGATTNGYSYGPTFSNGVYSGYAWGSNVVGWVNFNVASTTGAPSGCSGVCNVHINSSATIDAQLAGSSIAGNAAVPFASNVSLVWTVTNLASGATCAVSKTSAGGTSFTTINNVTSSGSASTGGLTQGSYTYQIQCSTGSTVLSTATVSFTVSPQPPGFVISGPSSLAIQFLNQTGATSQSGTFFVDNGGTAYSNPVTVTVSGISPALPSGTTVMYSFNGGAFSSTTPSITIPSPYSTGVSVQVKFNKNIGSTQYTVTLSGSGSGAPTATKSVIITPAVYNPGFQEF